MKKKATDRSYLFGAIIVLVLVLGLPQPSSGILFVLAVIYVFISKENESKLAYRLSDLQNHLYELQKVYRNKS